MYANNFAPDNNSAGKVNQTKIIISLFLETNQKFTETIEKRVCHFHNPTTSFKGRVVFNFLFLITARPYICSIALTFDHLFGTCITSIQTQMLWLRRRRFRTKNYNAFQCLLQQFNIVSIRTR